MKYQVRRGVFETNSSSMHSISVMGAPRMVDKSVFPDELVLTGDEYGWSGPPLTSYVDKLNYMVTEYQYREDMLELIRTVYEDYTGKRLVIDIDEDDYIYIDHQSQGTIAEFIGYFEGYEEKSLNEALADFIFNENKFIIIDNDNH